MLELLRDPDWQFVWQPVNVVLMLAAIAVAFWIYRLQRPLKKIEYAVMAATRLLTVREEVEGKVQVLYEGTPTKDLSLLILRIQNAGSVPVATTDFEVPYSLQFGSKAKVLSVEATKCNPPSLSPELAAEGDRITLRPTLLNAGDTIEIKALVADFDGEVSTAGRVLGVSRLGQAPEIPRIQLLCLALGIALCLGCAALLWVQPVAPTPPATMEAKVAMGLGFAGMLLCMLFLSWPRGSRTVLAEFRKRV
jgi:hypothetical protein